MLCYVQHDADKSQRVTVHEAAELLGITPEAVRARLYRGTLERKDGEDGTVYVRLHADQLQPHDNQSPNQSELVQSLQDQIGYLRAQLDTRTEELREHRRIIAALTQRIPELPPASSESTRDAPQSPETATAEEAEQRPGGAQEGAQRPWWRRVFGG
jgi:hypothetical protein